MMGEVMPRSGTVGVDEAGESAHGAIVAEQPTARPCYHPLTRSPTLLASRGPPGDAPNPHVQILFTLVSALGLAYFLLTKRRFDWLSIAYFSAVIYAIPGFVGRTRVHHYEMPIHPEAYAVMVTVLVAIVTTAALLDHGSRVPRRIYRIPGSRYLPAVLAVTALVGFTRSVQYAGAELLLPDKSQILDSFTFWHRIWATGATLGTVVCFARRAYGWMLVCVALNLIWLFVGFRVFVTISVVGILTTKLASLGKRRLGLASPRIALITLAFVALLFAYKRIYILIKMGDFDSVSSTLSGEGFLEDAIMRSEPFTTQHILNAIVSLDVRIGMQHFQEVLHASFYNMFTADNLRADFNEKFQPVFFGDVRGGMASNVWAEMWSAGGWPMLLLFVALFIGVLYWVSSRWTAFDGSVKGVLGTLMPYWAFYIHRNDSYRLLSFLKQYSLLLLGALMVSTALSLLMMSREYPDADARIPARLPGR